VPEQPDPAAQPDPRERPDPPEQPDPAGPDTTDDQDAVARLALERAREAARAKGFYRAPSPRRRRGTTAEPAPDPADGAPAPGSWRPGPGLGYGISGPGPSRRDPQALGGIAARLFTQRGWSVPLSVGGVVGRWREVVGDQVADHCQVETFEEGALVLRTTSTAWATQVRLLLPQLERRLAEEVGEGTVTSITVLGPGGPGWKHGRRSVPGRGPRDTYG
jgi:predicted nucleic acid-binding Zn ribbon protein